ncbi:FtsQ-type POTRA domain-containing protein [Bdellovibrio sp. 22V]|uniref:cell division protein FtsQ/DivIB n=1 Tax=Bdellovibrio TaxID=958 RepID=UPI0025427906|nr:cell division protein FtsQ/DivIB [Bdellovibrio sp. 22V]WII72829.1 FtsQ-type POTRA domain-containing protein [Bdellovibrio sp. 22V]
MKKLVLQLIFGFVILPLSLAGTLYYLNKNGFFNISKVEVVLENPPRGQEQFLRPLVDNLESSLAKYKGLSLWNIKLKKVSGDVKKLGWVEGLNVKRSWPATLSIRVRPHEVKLLFMAKSGKLVPIIKDGSFLEPIEIKQAPDVALLEGESFVKKTELRKKAVEVIEQIPAEGSFSKKTISEIRYDNKEGFWMTLIKTGIQVKMGEDQVALKAARVSQVVDYLESRQFDARVIDANLSKKVLVRLRKDP